MLKLFSYRLPLKPVVIALGMIITLVSGSSEAQEVVHVGGTGAGTLIIQRMIELYTKASPEAKVEAIMPPLGSSGGFNAIAKGAIQLAIVSRLPDPGKLSNIVVVPWLKTPFVLVARDAPARTNLSQAQVADIYVGRMLKWEDGKPIRLVMRAKGDADITLLSGVSPVLAEAAQVAFKRPGLPTVENDIDNQQMLEQTPGAFGVMSLAQVLLSNSKLKPLAFDGVTPSIATMLDGSYPHERKFYLLVESKPSASTIKFLEYLRSPIAIEQLTHYGLALLAS